MFIKKSNYSLEDLLNCGKGKLFGKGNAQLPLPPLLMFDKITNICDIGGKYNKGFLNAELNIKSDFWFFDCHFYNDPIMPGCLGLDALWQMTGFWLGWSGKLGKGRAISVGEVKFSKMITPNTKLIKYVINIKKIRSSNISIGIADGYVMVNKEIIYKAYDLKVALFK